MKKKDKISCSLPCYPFIIPRSIAVRSRRRTTGPHGPRKNRCSCCCSLWAMVESSCRTCCGVRTSSRNTGRRASLDPTSTSIRTIHAKRPCDDCALGNWRYALTCLLQPGSAVPCLARRGRQFREPAPLRDHSSATRGTQSRRGVRASSHNVTSTYPRKVKASRRFFLERKDPRRRRHQGKNCSCSTLLVRRSIAHRPTVCGCPPPTHRRLIKASHVRKESKL
jgi:hypothetical protein